MKDELFKQKLNKQFEFDENVASVFDDMIDRSVPFYKQNLELICKIIANLAGQGDKICDLGCSTASLLLELFKRRKDLVLSGIDNSKAMLEIAQKKALAYGARIEFIENNLTPNALFASDIFIANYTLQFIRPPQRQALVDSICANLSSGGIFMLSEKISYEEPKIAKLMLELYASYKKEQGYSEFEIASKREALENVLVPYSEKENRQMLENAGFTQIHSLFKWANFMSFIAFKP